MAPRPRSSSAPGSGRGRAGRRPGRTPPATRRTSRVAAAPAGPTGTSTSKATLTGRAAILLLVVAVLAVSYASSMRAWLQQRSDVNALTAEIAEREATVAALKQEKQRWRDPAYIEAQARLRFGWLMPGETGYRVIGDDGKVLNAGTSELSDPPQAVEEAPEWWQGAWGSVVEAGKDPEAAAEQAEPQRTPIDQIGGGRPDRQKPGDR